jgi:hypothetical protein
MEEYDDEYDHDGNGLDGISDSIALIQKEA